jgi:flavin reductase (DIM6/NTAB) family NADH-FMN oxidoreductase RutF
VTSPGTTSHGTTPPGSSRPRTAFVPAEMSPSDFYRVMNSVVVPRPIAWVCSRSAAGVHNLAPHSFYTVACVQPPVVQFTSVGRKDSLNNVEATGDFTVNLVPEELFEQANATGTDFPPDQSEAEAAGVRLEPSEKVSALRVAQSPVSIECTLHSTLRLGDSTVVFGRVEWVSVFSSAVQDGRPRIEELRPLARLGGNEWCTVGDLRVIRRIPYTRWAEDPSIGEQVRGS